MSRSADVRGLIPVLATPFHPDGSLDTGSLRRLVEFSVRSGVDGVAVFGFASEGFTLTTPERAAILAVVREALGPALPIVAGVSATGTGDAIDQCRAAADAGASVAMLIPPFMVKPSPRRSSTSTAPSRRPAGCRSWCRTRRRRPGSTCRCRSSSSCRSWTASTR
ncbi:hypothetical protein GCM10027610_142970 [Dactylosporangium cerinum]